MVGFPLDSRVTYVTDPGTGVITPQYDRAVTSKPLKEYIRGIITTGVLPNPSDNLQVFPGTDGMTVIVHAGFAVIDGGLAKEDNNRTLEVTASDATYDRIDTVVVRWNDNDSVRNVDLYIKQGVPARNPVRPTLTREGSVYEIGLADIFVTKNVRTITAEKITDTRLESARCGVASSVAEWDTTTIYQQIQSDLAGFKTNEQAEFMAWFNKMKDQLTEDAAGHLQLEIEDLATTRSKLGAKNLLPYPYYNTTITVNEVTFTDNGDGTITVNGTSTAISPGASSFVFINDKAGVIPAGTYKCTVEGWSGDSAIDWWYIYDRTTRQDIASPSKNAFTYNGMDILYFRYIVRAGKTVSNLTLKPMIRLATDHDSTYQPYAMTNKELTDAAAGLSDVDGRLTQVQSQIHTNILNPTAPTQTINGVTLTNNGDGTYTVNGTASNIIYYQLANQFTNFVLSRKYKIVGCPQGGSENTYSLYDDSNKITGTDVGNGAVYTPKNKPIIYIRIMKGTTCNNLLFKPMLTTDLNATYDDFVPYTGDSGRLNEDVANLIKGISPITNSEIDTILNS